MPGPRQPTDLVKARGKKHFSQTEEDQRRDQEVHVQPPDRAEPPRWLGKKFHAEFREIGEILTGFSVSICKSIKQIPGFASGTFDRDAVFRALVCKS